MPRAGTHTGKTLVISFQRPQPPSRPGRRPPAAIGIASSADERQAAGPRHAGPADADGADASAREAAAGAARRDSHAHGAGGPRDRGPALLLPSRHRSHPHGRRAVHEHASATAVPGRRQHDHAAAREELLPDREMPSSSRGQRSLAPQAARAVHGARPRSQGDQGRDPRAVPERRLSGPARLVRHPRRRRGGAPLLRQGCHEHLARRGRHDRRHHSIAGHAVAVQLAGAGARAPQRRPASDGGGRLHSAEPPSASIEGTASLVARALDAEAPYFVDFVGQTLAEQFPASRDDRGRRRLHDARPAPAAARAGRRAQRPRQGRRDAARRRRGRVPQAALIAVDPRTGDILALVGGRSYNQSQYNRAVSAGGSRDRCSSRSSISPRSSAPPRTAPR